MYETERADQERIDHSLRYPKHGHMTRFENGQCFIEPCPYCRLSHWVRDYVIGQCPETGLWFKVVDRRPRST